MTTELSKSQFHWSIAADGEEGTALPATGLSFEEALAYALVLSELDIQWEYRLPSRAEWMTACNGGGEVRFWWGNSSDGIELYANTPDRRYAAGHERTAEFDCDDGYAELAPMGVFRANPLGLYDMIGNVAEFVSDPWLDGEGALDLAAAERAVTVCGGSWHSASGCRDGVNAVQWLGSQSSGKRLVGFRLVATAK